MTSTHVYRPPMLQAQDNKLIWSGLQGVDESIAIAAFVKQHNRPVIVLTSSLQESYRLIRELRFFVDSSIPIHHFPDWEILTYDHFSPHEDIVSDRLALLHRLPSLQQGIVVAALSTVMHYTLPKLFLQHQALVLSQDQLLDLTQFTQQCIDVGYHRTEQVRMHGEISIRGSIIDIFPLGSHVPYRIELFDNQVESMRAFNPDTQCSDQVVHSIEVLPAREYTLTDDGVSRFRQGFRQLFSGNATRCPIYNAISAGEPFPGAEYYLPLFYETVSHFFEYMPSNSILFTPDNIAPLLDQLWRDIQHRYDQLRHDIQRPLCAPNQIFLDKDQFFNAIKPFTTIRIAKNDPNANTTFKQQHLPDLRPSKHDTPYFKQLFQFCQDYTGRILLTAESAGRQENLLSQLAESNIRPTKVKSWHAFVGGDDALAITTAPLDLGTQLDGASIALIPEALLFGEQVMQRRRRSKATIDPAQIIHHLDELKIGSPVVHVNYGIGFYQGLTIISTGTTDAEFMALEYAGGDKLFVPVGALHLISRYSGIDVDHVKPTRLGTNKWSQAKEKAIKKIHDVAAELLQLYSEREIKGGHAYPPPDADYLQFRRDFPFEETPDQSAAIDSVIDDLTANKSMDRLICGDVGFGKTEVAMQAAFFVAQRGKQVAMLAPTTLLAEQHYQNFCDRFADWPIKIAVLSRLQSTNAQTRILSELQSGTIDIVIGTHKLLQSSVDFKSLGLLIVDEEQRFGVRQKEKIRSLRAAIDILTLTATPIPRTLNMAFGGMRDLSIISTPPQKRLSVKTFLYEKSDAIIHEAILREISRGGQVYYLHNDVATMEATTRQLRTRIPEARIEMAHGQMRESQLERVMSNFYHQRFNVLVCSTIIESGIDIPSANTIIIDRADKFGLSQLHQLRGRVGRSHHQAYAYLLVPCKKTLTKDAEKRLDAISTFEELGSGFLLATHDLEIRGAGELLGGEQSGHIESIGYSLYMTLLDEAIQTLRAGKSLDPTGLTQTQPIEINHHQTAILPSEYVHDVGVRLSFYKRLANQQSDASLQSIKAELIDRFGPLPIEAEQLIETHRCRIIAEEVDIIKIDIRRDSAVIQFSDSPSIDSSALIRLIQNSPNTYHFEDATRVRLRFNDQDSDDQYLRIKQFIHQIRLNQPPTPV